MKNVVVRFIFVSGLAILLAPISPAQEVTAAIIGRVTDPTGGAIAGAKVTAIDTQRGTQWPTVTNGDGAYNLPRVPVGVYNIKAENQGFQSTQQSNVTFVLNQVARLDFQLQVGNISESVEVTSAAPILQTESTQLGQIIDARTNTALPLATRNYVQLTLLAPGSVHPDPSTFKNGQTTANSGRPYVNGNREQANNFLLDGVDNNQVSDNLVGYAPSVDAIQEFNEITNNASAEFGNFMGGIISTTIKSGTNQYHGGVFEFFRNDVVECERMVQQLQRCCPQCPAMEQFRRHLRRSHQKRQAVLFRRLPGPAFCESYDYQRCFSDDPTGAGRRLFSTVEPSPHQQQTAIQLYNPFAIGADGNRVPFAGNIIPTTLLESRCRQDSHFAVLPVAYQRQSHQQLFFSTHSAINGDQGDAKVDWNISDKDRVFGALFAERDRQSQHQQPSAQLQRLRQFTQPTMASSTGPVR